MKECKGLVDPVAIAVIAICFAVGGYFYFKSDAIDSPAEQIAESVLHDEGIDIDFSKAKKDRLKSDRPK